MFFHDHEAKLRISSQPALNRLRIFVFLCREPRVLVPDCLSKSLLQHPGHILEVVLAHINKLFALFASSRSLQPLDDLCSELIHAVLVREEKHSNFDNFPG